MPETTLLFCLFLVKKPDQIRTSQSLCPLLSRERGCKLMLCVGFITSIYFVHKKVNFWVQGHALVFENVARDVGQSEGFMWTQIESNVHDCVHCWSSNGHMQFWMVCWFYASHNTGDACLIALMMCVFVVKQLTRACEQLLCVGLRTSIFFVRGKVNSWAQGHALIFENVARDVGRNEGFVWTQIESNVHACMHSWSSNGHT